MQKIHLFLADKKTWVNEWKGSVFFSHGKTNSCPVAIEYIKSRRPRQKINDKNEQILILMLNLMRGTLSWLIFIILIPKQSK